MKVLNSVCKMFTFTKKRKNTEPKLRTLTKRKKPTSKSLHTLMMLLKIHGVWSQGNSWKNRLRGCYPVVVLGFAFYRMLVLHLMDIITIWGDDLAVCESSILLFTILNAVIKMGTLFLYKDRIKELVVALEKLYTSEQLLDKAQKRLRLKTLRNANKLTIWYPVIYTTLAALFTLLQIPKALASRSFHFRGWFPYDINQSPNFELSLLFWSITIVCNINLLSVCDATILVLLMHAVGQFRLLRSKMSDLRSLAVKKLMEEEQVRSLLARLGRDIPQPAQWRKAMTLDKHSKRKIKRHVDVATNSRARQNGIQSIHKQNKLRCHNIPHRHNPEQDVKSLSYRKILNDRMECLISECAHSYEELLSWKANFEIVFNSTFILQFSFNMLITGIIALYFTLAPETFDSKGRAFIQILVGCVVQFYLYCWFSNQLTQEAEDVREAVYDSDWLDASLSFKKSMMIIMSTANVPIVVTVASFLPLNLKMFQKVTENAYSYYVAMLYFANGTTDNFP